MSKLLKKTPHLYHKATLSNFHIKHLKYFQRNKLLTPWHFSLIIFPSTSHWGRPSSERNNLQLKGSQKACKQNLTYLVSQIYWQKESLSHLLLLWKCLPMGKKNVKKDLRLPEFAGPADFILLSDVRKSSENTSTEWQPTSFWLCALK